MIFNILGGGARWIDSDIGNCNRATERFHGSGNEMIFYSSLPQSTFLTRYYIAIKIAIESFRFNQIRNVHESMRHVREFSDSERGHVAFFRDYETIAIDLTAL